jgi:CRP-like cAMP-binding protein
VPLFAGLDRVARAKVASYLEALALDEGAVLCREGEPGDALYLVSRGSLGVFRQRPDGDEARLSTLATGDVAGEMALLTEEPRSATIRAEAESEVLRLGRGRFLGLIKQDPAVALAIAGTLSRRVRAADDARLGVEPGSDAPLEQAANKARASRANARSGARWRTGAVLLMAAALLGAGWLAPPPTGLSVGGWRALASLLAIVPVLSLGVLPDLVVALALAAYWVIGGVASPQVAMSGFASSSWVLIVAISAFGAVIGASGLLFRAALWGVLHLPRRFAIQAAALTVSGMLVTPIVPSSIARATLVAPVLREMAEELGYAARSRAAAGLAMATLLGFGNLNPFFTSTTSAIAVHAMLPPDLRAQVDWGTWTLWSAPSQLILFVLSLAAIVWSYRPDSSEVQAAGDRRELIALQQVLLGPLSQVERRTLAVTIGFVVALAAQPLHRIDAAWVTVGALVALGVLGALPAEALRGLNWNLAILFGAMGSMAAVFASTGLDRWLGGLLAPLLGGVAAQPPLVVMTVCLLGTLASLALPFHVGSTLLAIAVLPVAAGTGVSPWVIAYSCLIGAGAWLLPRQSAIYLALYQGTGSGELFTHEQAKPAAWSYAVLRFVALAASVPVWHALGLL